MFVQQLLYWIIYIKFTLLYILTPPSYTDAFKVFARMSPQGKAAIIRAIQDHDKDAHVFMCGDGGNDVGALKQVSSSMSRVEIGIMMLLWSVWFVAVLVCFILR